MLNKTFRSLRTNSRRKVLKLRNTIGALLIALLSAMLAMFTATGAAAEDWPQFRGPNGSGVSVSTGLPEVFGPEKNVVWKTPLPPGHSSPVLTRDRVFVTAYAEDGNAFTYVIKQAIFAFVMKDGKVFKRAG